MVENAQRASCHETSRKREAGTLQKTKETMQKNTEPVDQGFFVPNDDAASEAVSSTTQPSDEHPCGYCDRVFGSAPALRMHIVRKHSGRNWDTSKNFRTKKKGRPWIPGQLEKFRATMRKRAMRVEAGGKKSKRIQIVYPDPREAESEQVTQPEIRFCPYCGFNIERHK